MCFLNSIFYRGLTAVESLGNILGLCFIFILFTLLTYFTSLIVSACSLIGNLPHRDRAKMVLFLSLDAFHRAKRRMLAAKATLPLVSWCNGWQYSMLLGRFTWFGTVRRANLPRSRLLRLSKCKSFENVYLCILHQRCSRVFFKDFPLVGQTAKRAPNFYGMTFCHKGKRKLLITYKVRSLLSKLHR